MSSLGNPHESAPNLRRREPDGWSTASFDRAFVGDPRQRKPYVICSTPRSGSWLLCRQLFRANLGVPHEYFHDLFAGVLQERYGVATIAAYLAALRDRRTTSNGVWGTKLHWYQFKALSAATRADLFRDVRCLYLQRSSAIEQAISLYVAMQTQVWVGALTQTDVANLPARFYDDSIDRIQTCIKNVHYGNLQWQRFFYANGIRPLVVFYDDFVRQQPQTIARIAEALSLERGQFQLPEPEPNVNNPHAEALKQQLKAHYLEHSPDRALRLLWVDRGAESSVGR